MKNKEGQIVSFNDIMKSPKVYVREWVTDKDGKLKVKEVLLDTNKVKKNWDLYQSGNTDKLVPVVGTSINAKTDVDLQPYVKQNLYTPTEINKAKQQLQVNQADYLAAKQRIGTEGERAGDQLAVQTFESMQAESKKNTADYLNSLYDPLNLNGTKTKKSNSIMDMIWGGNNPFTGNNRVENTNQKEQSVFQKSLKNFFTGNFASPVYASDVTPYSNTPQYQNQGFVDGTPDEYKQLIAQASTESGVPTSLLSALLKKESSFLPEVINGSKASSAGAQGIAQFMPATASAMGINPLDPKSAIPGAAKYLKQLYDQFGSWDLALAAYNAGPGNVQKAGNQIPNITETKNYVNTIKQWMNSASSAVNESSSLGLGNRPQVLAAQGNKLMKSINSIALPQQYTQQTQSSGNLFTRLLDAFKKNISDNKNYGVFETEDDNNVNYTVGPSDTIRSIAERYNISPIALTSMVGDKGIVTGQILNIPKLIIPKYQQPVEQNNNNGGGSPSYLNKDLVNLASNIPSGSQPSQPSSPTMAALQKSMSSSPVTYKDSSGWSTKVSNSYQSPVKESSAQLAVQPSGNPISNVTNAVKSGISSITSFFKKLFG